jgi:lysophospholipase L1-like esterase
LAGPEGETTPTNDRWPTYLADRLRTEFRSPSNLVVVEPGVGIGSHALDLSRALGRLEPTILSQNTAKYVIVLDDIEESRSIHTAHEAATIERIIAWHRKNIEQAHALGLKVFGGTVTAFEGARLPDHTESTEANREAVNAWIRSSKAYDGIVDFDLATRDPAQPKRLLPAYDSGDHLHPNAAGYRAMADAIDLSLLEE